MIFPGTALNHVLTKLSGAPFKYAVEPKSENEEPVLENITIRYALCNALTFQRALKEGEKPVSGMTKLELYQLASRIQNHDVNKNIEFTSAEIVLLQRKCDDAWGVEIYGFLHQFLEGKLDFPPFPTETAN